MGDQPREAGRIPVAAVMRAADLVSYQEGAVVSRTIVKRDTGNITLFACVPSMFGGLRVKVPLTT